MPKRKDLKKILIIGSGPIIIGQACEFDYSGSQACKALKEEGYKIVLVNSNPATIMTDPQMADRTYIEPLTPEVVTEVIKKEKPDALLPTLGGQTGLNIAYFLNEQKVLKKYGVEVIGANAEAIAKAEDREKFKDAMGSIGLKVPRSGIARNLDQGIKLAEQIGFPLILRAAFCLGGSGGSCVYNREEYEELLQYALDTSPIGEVLVEQSVLGWKEIEFEVMRDCNDNVITVCSMENLDPMGVHTGDSMVVAPAQTITAKECLNLTNWSKKVIRAINITGGGTNLQFAVNPDNGEVAIIEINPRVSRSSALASKATGFPIARVATKLAVGLTLDEVVNEITGGTSTFFEPTIDYCVFKMPRFTFEKFTKANQTLGISMKAVGESMSIGRNFKEALQKGLRSLETGRYGLGADGIFVLDEKLPKKEKLDLIREKLKIPNADRIFFIREAMKQNIKIDEIYELSRIDRWFLHNIKEIIELEEEIKNKRLTKDLLGKAKEFGFSDHQLAYLKKKSQSDIRDSRKKKKIGNDYKLVDTCAGEFEAAKPYFYSTYSQEDESRATKKKKVVILGGGPNRIGQGIEFDYCCCHASYALREIGYESVIINSNPETVSTDYDTSDRLYFEPLTLEDVLNVIDKEKPYGVIVQLGGQTPLNIAKGLEEAGVKILGTSPENIDIAEDRERFKKMLNKLKMIQPENGTAVNLKQARAIARRVGYPVIVRPSYVLGGRAMEIVYDDKSLENYMREAVVASPKHPVLIDKFLEDAIEVDVDMIADGRRQVIGGIMEHIEEAGVHSGDSAMVLPPYSLSEKTMEDIKRCTYKMAQELKVKGLMNVQYAVKNGKIYVLEVNPRASRTIPLVSKAIGVPLAKLATKVMAGLTLSELGFTNQIIPEHISVKESVFPFSRFPGVDIILGPEMKSTGEVMGIDKSFGRAYVKSQISAGQILPTEGTIFISVKDQDKPKIIPVARKLQKMKFKLIATKGTAEFLSKNNIKIEKVFKLHEGRPHIVDLIKSNEINLVINTPGGKGPKEDEIKIRTNALMHRLPCITTVPGATASVNGIEALRKKKLSILSLQEYHKKEK
jgi:carbamoyl-phosphate synthase large subunit